MEEDNVTSHNSTLLRLKIPSCLYLRTLTYTFCVYDLGHCVYVLHSQQVDYECYVALSKCVFLNISLITLNQECITCLVQATLQNTDLAVNEFPVVSPSVLIMPIYDNWDFSQQ